MVCVSDGSPKVEDILLGKVFKPKTISNATSEASSFGAFKLVNMIV